MFAKFFVAAAMLTAVSASIGDTIIENNCAFPVYLWSVSNVAGPEVIIPVGGVYTEQFYTNPNGGGISVKMAANSAATTITQFEYTLDGSALWYDVSNINGYPFESWGLTLVPSDPTCPSVTCDAGVAQCKDVYNQSDDNAATHECESSANMVMVLCSGNVVAASSLASSAIATATSAKLVSLSPSTSSSTSAPKPTPTSTSTTVKAPSTTLATSTKAATSTLKSSSTTTTTTTSKSAVVSVAEVAPAAATSTSTSTTPAPAPAAAATSSANVDVVLTTTYTTVYVTEGGVTKTSSSAVTTSVAAVTTSEAPSTTAAPAVSTEAATSTTSTANNVFHGHTFNWPAFTGFPGAKVRRGHQHFHAHAHGAHA